MTFINIDAHQSAKNKKSRLSTEDGILIIKD